MGACIGKKSSKYRHRNQSQSDIKQASQPKIQDDISGNKSTPTPSEKLPVTDGPTANNDVEWRVSQLDETSIDSELQIIIDQQQMINETFNQLFPSRIISVTDTELEYELANLIFEHPEKDSIETSFTVTTDQRKDV